MSSKALLPFLLSHDGDGCLSARQKGWRDGGMKALRAATWHRVELGILPFLLVFFSFSLPSFSFFLGYAPATERCDCTLLVGIFAMLAIVARCSHLANIHPKLLGPIHMSSWGGTKREGGDADDMQIAASLSILYPAGKNWYAVGPRKDGKRSGPAYTAHIQHK